MHVVSEEEGSVVWPLRYELDGSSGGVPSTSDIMKRRYGLKKHTAETFPFLVSSLWIHSDGGHDSPSGYRCALDTHVEADEYVLLVKYQTSAVKGIFLVVNTVKTTLK